MFLNNSKRSVYRRQYDPTKYGKSADILGQALIELFDALNSLLLLKNNKTKTGYHDRKRLEGGSLKQSPPVGGAKRNGMPLVIRLENRSRYSACDSFEVIFYIHFTSFQEYQQGHHHDGDQTARRLRMMCSICGCRFATSPYGVRGSPGWAYLVARPWVPISSPLTHVVYLLPVSSYLAGSKNISVRPSDPDTIKNTGLETTASSSGTQKPLQNTKHFDCG